MVDSTVLPESKAAQAVQLQQEMLLDAAAAGSHALAAKNLIGDLRFALFADHPRHESQGFDFFLQAGQLELLLFQHLVNVLHKALQSTICGGRLEVTPFSSVAAAILRRMSEEVNSFSEQCCTCRE